MAREKTNAVRSLATEKGTGFDERKNVIPGEKEWEQAQKRKDEQRVQRLRLFDDEFFRVSMKGNKAAIEKMLQIILENESLKVTKSRTQEDFPNLRGKSCTFDVHAVDSEKKHYDIEIQIDSRGAKPKRARYHSSIYDSNVKNPGKYLDRLPETYVIFITEKDVLKGGLPLYTIDRCITNQGNRPFNDEAHIIYVNGEADTPDTELGKLMHDLKSRTAESMYIKELKESVEKIKGRKKEEDDMESVFDEVRREAAEFYSVAAKEQGMKEGMKEGMKKGIKQGRVEGKKLGSDDARREIARNMKQEGDSDDKITRVTGLPRSVVAAL